MTRKRRSLGFAVLGGVFAVLLLGGCSLVPYPEIPRYAESGGQTQAQLDATLGQIEGLTFTKASGSRPNVKGNTGYGYDVTLDPSYKITDWAAFIAFLVESAWSVRDGYMPNTSVEIAFFGVLADDIDLTVVAEDAGWIPKDTRTHRGMAENGASCRAQSRGAGEHRAHPELPLVPKP